MPITRSTMRCSRHSFLPKLIESLAALGRPPADNFGPDLLEPFFLTRKKLLQPFALRGFAKCVAPIVQLLNRGKLVADFAKAVLQLA